MTALLPETGSGVTVERLLLQYEIEQFLYHEADLLTRHELDAWLELFTDDLRYYMPIRRNHSSRDPETIEDDGALAVIDDDKSFLAERIAKIHTGKAWADDPLARVRHLVTNVVVGEADPETGEITVDSYLLINRNRLEDEQDSFVCGRTDRLRRTPDGLRISRRRIMLDQSVILSKNMSVMF
ncbi:aromatic-ring-hydroxylating dioxygenase subunit beta [Streptomyces griseiscabiei]|uniref:3-phenylpropionate/cinnamic acid dioxygenase subunit beta n=1 Tax=Streptomyces griseiscabiei TaxID=2993540 RepID=A0ABU4LGL7_9ACTN|nr:3-phenylpropionate/cinnamic acid dioxygenase subunit beta [Streptomyces griseiscabiei]MBZ3900422.1 3-phenylpropionate/cinnamic acid dioxygenase subunit beta [Streptomyces griseiscabiei]MDX2914590.1 3-phenylpropionate/cinnamic acid dioxygenase subunit beta [Streptomyces griseiscabiei]